MKKFIMILLLSFTNICLACNEAEHFFKDYQELARNFNPEISALYSDTAKISTFRVYPHGLERQMELTGMQWKLLMQKVMPLAKARNDKSTFSNVLISKTHNGYRIKADRYSELKCYKDTGYYMTLEKVYSKLLITEEYMETRPQSYCHTLGK